MIKMKRVILILISITIAILAAFFIFIKNDIVASYVTKEHYRYSPVELNGEIYFPSTIDFNDKNNSKSIGLLKGNSFIIGEVLVDESDTEYTKFSVIDDFPMDYYKGSYLQSKQIIDKNMGIYNDFVLCSDKNDMEKRLTIDKDIIKELQDEFKFIEYNVEDFKSCDDIYYIYVNSAKEKIHDKTFDSPIIYMGSILVEGNKLYYCNFKNEIKGQLYDKLKNYIN